MTEFYATFQKSIMRTDKVASFLFRPEHPLDFAPGQFAQVIFDDMTRSNKALNKYLSFSNRPGLDYFEMTKKLSGSHFCVRLCALKTGDRVLFKGPMGHCVLKENDGKVGFLVGGIGITPAISMIDQVMARHWPTDVCLIYSNWTPRDIAFKTELDAWSRENAKINVVHVLADCKLEGEKYFSGIITDALVREQVPDFKERTIFIFGPPAMVTAMMDICAKLGIDKARIKAETFVGY